MKLAQIVDALEKLYGPLKAPVTDPFDIILHENASYLVDDAQRLKVFRKLRDEIGNDPETILDHDARAIEAAIAEGGMLPPLRAQKVIKAARLAVEIGLDAIRAAIASDLKQAKKLLKRFPGAGDPLADRILLFSNAHSVVSPDSNALRVLTRLGYGSEEKNYSKTYKSAVESVKDELTTPRAAQRAYLLLRHHGQELCRKTAPRCELCPLRKVCAWYQANARPRNE